MKKYDKAILLGFTDLYYMEIFQCHWCWQSSPSNLSDRLPGSRPHPPTSQHHHALPEGCLLFHNQLKNSGFAHVSSTATRQYNNSLAKTGWPVFSELLC